MTPVRSHIVARCFVADLVSSGLLNDQQVGDYCGAGLACIRNTEGDGEVRSSVRALRPTPPAHHVSHLTVPAIQLQNHWSKSSHAFWES